MSDKVMDVVKKDGKMSENKEHHCPLCNSKISEDIYKDVCLDLREERNSEYERAFNEGFDEGYRRAKDEFY